MARVRDILDQKDGSVQTAQPETTVLEAVRVMNDHKMGALVVTDASNRVVGIFTERDVLCRIVAEQRDPASIQVGQVMSDQVICASDQMAVATVQTLMKQRRIRHLPVVDGEDRLIGIISIGDVNAHFANDNQVELEYLHEYIHGRT